MLLTGHISDQWLKAQEHFLVFTVEFNGVKLMIIILMKL